jgi:hypothetical protein
MLEKFCFSLKLHLRLSKSSFNINTSYMADCQYVINITYLYKKLGSFAQRLKTKIKPIQEPTEFSAFLLIELIPGSARSIHEHPPF